ncbi:MAG: hypothetical protein Ct9H300mP25_14420 [Acidobacteriota bacterium]|nr:MAG: hypothetical protein Ct9H300mP25_14420 [Acidobacteriota bacterium]
MGGADAQPNKPERTGCSVRVPDSLGPVVVVILKHLWKVLELQGLHMKRDKFFENVNRGIDSLPRVHHRLSPRHRECH